MTIHSQIPVSFRPVFIKSNISFAYIEPEHQDLKSYDLAFKGSSNQRTIDVKASLEKNVVGLTDL